MPAPDTLLKHRVNKPRKSVDDAKTSPQEWQNMPTTLVILELSTKCSSHAASYLVNKLRMPHDDEGSGAGLSVREVHDKDSRKIRWLHVTCPTERLLEAAEWHDVRLPDSKDGLMREFTTETLSSFTGKSSSNASNNRHALNSLLTDAERRRLVYVEILRLRAGSEQADTHALYKSDNVRFHAGQSIIQKLLRRGLIHQIYPLHDKEERQKLYTNWVSANLLSTTQPLEQVRSYFGEQIALYFAFLDYYNYCLLFPAAIGVILYIFGLHLKLVSLILYAACNIVFVAAFLESWKRRSNELTYRWGTIHRTKQDEAVEPPRPAFKGTIGVNMITNRPELIYPPMRRFLIVALVTVPVIFLCCLFAFWLMLLYFEWEAWSIQMLAREPSLLSNKIIRYAPTTVYSVVVAMLNLAYRNLATRLNDKENWRSQSEHESQLVIKLLVFDFVNNFISLFYIAFYLQDLNLLRRTLLFLIIVSMTVNQIPEIIIPYVMNKVRAARTGGGAKHRRTSQLTAQSELRREETERNISLDVNFQEAHERALYESKKEPYYGSFDDLAEIYVQFGYVFMFSSVYPVAAAFAVCMNAIELRSDAYKLCKIHQRPFAAPVAGIGIWQKAFEFLGLVAVMTNCALIALSPTVREMFPDTPESHLLLVLVVIEHALVGLSYFVVQLIPDIPMWVAVNMARVDYQSRQALKRVRALRSSVRMTELFKSREKLEP